MPPKAERSWPRRLLDFYLGLGPSQLAAAIAYRAVLGLFPLILAFLAVLNYLDPSRPLQLRVLAGLDPFLPEASRAAITQLVFALRLSPGLGGLLGVIGLLWTGSALVDALAIAFNRAYGVRNRGFLQEKHLSITVLLLVGLTTFLWGDLRSHLTGSFGLALAPYGTAGFLLLLFLLVYRLLPNLELPLRRVWPGAVFATVSVQLTGLFFRLYLQVIGIDRYGKIFGFLFLFLLWFYLLAHILILGAGLNAFLWPDRGAFGRMGAGSIGRPALEVLRGGRTDERNRPPDRRADRP